MAVRISGIVLAYVGAMSGIARAEVQINYSIAEFGAGAQLTMPSFGSGYCGQQTRVETLGTTELACLRESKLARAECIASVSMSTNLDNTLISMRFLSDSTVSGFDPTPKSVAPFAGGVGWATLGFSVSNEPMQFTLTIVDIGTNAGPLSASEVRAFLTVGGVVGSVTSHAGQTTQTGVFTGTIQPGATGNVFLEIENAIAEVTFSRDAFAHVELTLRFEPAACSGLNAAAVAADPIRWNNPAGGSYLVPTNWDPASIPVHDCERSDTAIFDLDIDSPIPINAADATAGSWRFLDGSYNITGPAEVFSPSAAEPSLEVDGASVTLSGSDPGFVWLSSVDAVIGQGLLHSVMEVITPGAIWENDGMIKVGHGELKALSGVQVYTDELQIGTVAGATATVRVTGVSGEIEPFVDVSGILSIGQVGPGEVMILDGAVALADEIRIGDPGDGAVTVRGTSNPGDAFNTDDFAFLAAHNSLYIGGEGERPLTIENGGIVQAKFVDIEPAPLGTGRVSVDGQGELAILNVLNTLTIGATESVEVEARNGGLIQAQTILIGSSQVRAGTADLTIRGSTSQKNPDRQSTLRVFDRPSTLGPAGFTYVGGDAPGQLNILDGGQASLDGGLRVGGATQGIVIVAAPGIPLGLLRSNLSVTGETLLGGNSLGILNIGPKSDLVTNGDLSIGLGGENLNGSLNLRDGSNVTVNGTLAVGVTGAGLLAANLGVGGLGYSFVRCDTLLVGGNTAQANGRVDANLVTQIEVSGNAQVGVGAGLGTVFLDDAASFVIGGTLTIGNPAGGPGGGRVVLVDANISGAGSIVVNQNGILSGTGTISVSKVNAGGQISPGLSPGTLTINGDYELLGTGVQIVEYAGLNSGEFDVLHVTGQTTLGGRLEVHFLNGFSPDDPAAFIQSQDFIEADQGVIGDYEQRIYAYPDLFADFDDDGDKDLSDLAGFQNCVAQSGTFGEECARADWERDGLIGAREVRELSARLSGPQ